MVNELLAGSSLRIQPEPDEPRVLSVIPAGQGIQLDQSVHRVCDFTAG